MKKLSLLFLALILATGAIHAQYFQHVYGGSGTDVLTGGINTNALGLGHFLVGSNSSQTLMVSWADVNGDIPGAPYFNKECTLVTSAGNVVYVRDAHAVEYANGSGFGIAGTYYDPSTSDQNIFYVQMDPSGNVTGVLEYIPAPSSMFQILTVAAITPSASGKEFYITGSVQSTAPEIHIYVLKIDITGALLWGYVYDAVNPSANAKDFAHDIIESPYSPWGIPEVVVVGNTYYSGWNSDGFFLRLDAATGAAFTGAAYLYGTPASWDVFNSISVANSTNGGSNGFIIGGGSDANGDLDSWLVKTDPSGNSLWGTLHDYNGMSGARNECNDVIERLNTSGKYEYYALGYTDNGLIGGYDMVAIKTDDAGNGVGLGQFTYGDGKFDYGVSIDQNNTGTADGLAMYGIQEDAGSGIGSYDMYLVKAYFNGESGCNEKIVDPLPKWGPGLYTKLPAKIVTKFSLNKMYEYDTPASDKTICFNTTIGSGSNALVMPGHHPGDDLSVRASPNPGYENIQGIKLDVTVETPADVQVTIHDMLGRLYHSGTYSLVKGNNTLPIPLGNASLVTGVYSVKISGAGNDMHTLFIVK